MADSHKLSADYVIVGAGIIGAMLAAKLAKTGASGTDARSGCPCHAWRNRGGVFDSPAAATGCRPTHRWTPHPTPSTSRKTTTTWCRLALTPYKAEYIRMVGGTSWHWAAHAWRNVPGDFKIKSLYGVGVDWPF